MTIHEGGNASKDEQHSKKEHDECQHGNHEKECGHKHSHHEEHEHHTHDHNCSHDHGHDHNPNHDHQHDHAHQHGPHCQHDHDSPENYQRYTYSTTELNEFSNQELDVLIQSVNQLLETENYGKAVPLLEIVFHQLESSKDSSSFNPVNLFETKHHLALSYGIIGEHDKSLPLWKEIILQLKNNDDIHETLEAYYNAALSAEQAKNKIDFLHFLNKGLEISIAHNLDHWEATFEHELGVHLFDSLDYQNAEKKLSKAIEILLKMEDDEGLVPSYYYLAYVYEKQNSIQKAKELYEKALTLSKQESIREYVEYERTLIEERLSAIKNNQLQNKLLNF
jgi:tetratricopeptide (TPR) repeat protein